MPTIPCSIKRNYVKTALCDLGAGVSVMPLSLYHRLDLNKLTPTEISLQMADYNAPRPLRQVSSSYSMLLPCHFLHVMHFISCHHVHRICIRVRLMHLSIFPVVRFAFQRSVLLRWSFLAFSRVWGLNISGLGRDLSCGLCLLPVDRLSSFVPFGLRLMLQRLTEGPKRPRVCCSPTPFQSGPKPT